MRYRAAIQVSVRIVICGFAAVAAWRALGDVGLVVVAPIFGVAFARPMIDACSALRQFSRNIVYKTDEGNYFAYHGQQLRVWEDEAQNRWVSVADVRKVLHDLPRDEALVRMLGQDMTQPRGQRDRYILASRLIDLLAKSQQTHTIKFKGWIAKEVYFPSGAARRQRSGHATKDKSESAA